MKNLQTFLWLGIYAIHLNFRSPFWRRVYCMFSTHSFALLAFLSFEMVFDSKSSLTRLLRLHDVSFLAHLTEPPNFHFHLCLRQSHVFLFFFCFFFSALPANTTHISSLTDSLSCIVWKKVNIFCSWFSFVSHNGLRERGTYMYS